MTIGNHSKLIGGILLVIGTTIGAGMLALPIATAALGFWGALILFIASWAVMTACGFLFLEVNLWLPADSNLISMAGATLGRWGQAIAWVTYLVLLYSLISAYVAGGGDLFHYLLQRVGLDVPQWLASLLFTFVLGAVVYMGIRAVDYVNRGLMFGKMGAYALVVVLLLPFVSMMHLNSGSWRYFTSASTITVTAVSFGNLMIIPSLRSYFGSDLVALRRAIFWGGFIPLICYILWDMAIAGIIPLNGHPGLLSMLNSNNSNSELVAALTTLVNKTSVTLLANFFISICMMTSFLSISLCLTDFLADGFKIKKQGLGNIPIFLGTFVPPLMAVIFYPDAFIRGLNLAGITIIILMVVLPPLMAWRGRYHLVLAKTATDRYQLLGGKLLLAILLVFATLMISCGLEGAL